MTAEKVDLPHPAALSMRTGICEQLPPLTDREVHIWHVPLDWDAAYVAELHCLLSEDERRRADRYHFHRDRDHFVVARGFMRSLLGSYLDLAPAQLRFTYSAHGKPGLDDSRLTFNLSHSAGQALLAVTLARAVGVDIEFLRGDFSCVEVARHFFSHREQAGLEALGRDAQTTAFFNCWTRKEAYIKARGEGLSLPLDQFDVSVAPGEPAKLVATRPDAAEAWCWTLRELQVEPGYVGAVAVEGIGLQMTQFKVNSVV